MCIFFTEQQFVTGKGRKINIVETKQGNNHRTFCTVFNKNIFGQLEWAKK